MIGKNARAAAHLLAEIKYNIVSVAKFRIARLGKTYLQGKLLKQYLLSCAALTFNYAYGKQKFSHVSTSILRIM